ncbi:MULTISPECIES: phage holin family protein [Halomonas]|uniref:phage holin family protein n=1 Tax=Halomonas TaxID=2745 RepID=UPI001C938CCF|nr:MULTISPECIES: phage holin family protein [Halomonas]MBY6209076.1 phage holin family protein [Halomonas sp. DP3Y7-2]MBY6229232.1 phage holin family protein [Halomonas sp. DP3Y7-1]MCA0917705.1 phage holin family protein [Halomonas denitrificans]
MPDLLLTAWLSFREFTAEPPVSAAIAAMTMAGLKILGSLPPRPPRKWLEIPMVGLASYGMVPISITLGADPSWAAGIGAGIGYVGMVKLETRIDRLLGVKGDKK